MAMFDGGAERFGERNGRIEVKPVHGITASGPLFAFYGSTEKTVGEGAAAEIECAQEIVFRTGAIDRGARLAVDKEHVVAFTPPAVLILEDGHGYAKKLTAAPCLEPDVVVLAIKILILFARGVFIFLPRMAPPLIGLRLPELRMEIEGALRQRMSIGAIVEIEVEELELLAAFVGHGDAGVFLEGHGEKAVERAVVGDGKKLGLPGVIVAEAKTEKIAERGFDTWSRLVVPIHAEHDALEMIRFVTQEREPDVGQLARPIGVEYGE